MERPTEPTKNRAPGFLWEEKLVLGKRSCQTPLIGQPHTARLPRGRTRSDLLR